MEENTKHKAKKSLGQNFLKSEPALRKIVESGDIQESELVLEIGPGKGALTKRLLESPGKIIAVEKDYDLIHLLKEKFAEEISIGKLILVQGDILNFDIEKYLTQNQVYKIIANIPYNITGAILKKFLTASRQPSRMVLMVQHEVAKRIVARDGKESVLSTSVKAYGSPTIVIKVPSRYFSPAPKVDSAVILIKDISRKTFQNGNINEEKFWEVVKMGFAHKRKLLSGNLKGVVDDIKINNSTIKNKRAENLTLLDWIAILK
ncbi:MAG: ribosomal RNA small subunit methyltransferase A [Candidatus Pacebacteria bacterium]|jgi:16S rRNA (adenine1518-N6/adenine1519-N6)-dimethyltransferase|nr:ribosomal RNA small subunit methyltransferase A [Candidatus Paceibacterota bacterium]